MKNNLTIKNRVETLIEVEKSKFVGICFPISSENDVNKYLDLVRKEHPKARHQCYAYILNGQEKYSDDGEPQGTAGKPILSQLESNNLTNTLLIVARYFGGTLLGSGRLLRTYLKSAKETIQASEKVELVEMNKYRVQIEIDFYQTFLNYLKRMGFIILNTSFNDKITLDFLTPKNFNEDLTSLYFGKLDLIGKINYIYRKDIA